MASSILELLTKYPESQLRIQRCEPFPNKIIFSILVRENGNEIYSVSRFELEKRLELLIGSAQFTLEGTILDQLAQQALETLAPIYPGKKPSAPPEVPPPPPPSIDLVDGSYSPPERDKRNDG